MPTYRIDRPGVDLPRVVVATLPAQALAHVANSELIVRRIEVDEAFELAGQGVQLERAGEAPPTPAAEPIDLGDANEIDAKDGLEPGDDGDGADDESGLGVELQDDEPRFYGEGEPSADETYKVLR